MITQINKTLAQQIVETVKDVCGYNINFITKNGIIFASTDLSRIGDFHEIGEKVTSTGSVIEVNENDAFSGTNKGINVPVFHNGSIIAVIGISGEPSEVRKYAYLAERITKLLIREQELGFYNQTQAEKRKYIVQALNNEENMNHSYLLECLKDLKIEPNQKKRVVAIQLNKKYNINNLSLIEEEINQLYNMTDTRLYTYYYPDKYLSIIEDHTFQKKRYLYEIFAKKLSPTLNIGIGESNELYHMKSSFDTAETALKSVTQHKTLNLAIFDDLTLEILTGNIGQNARNDFLKRQSPNWL